MRARRSGRVGWIVDVLLMLGGSLACLTADVIAPIFLSVDDHDTAAAT